MKKIDSNEIQTFLRRNSSEFEIVLLNSRDCSQQFIGKKNVSIADNNQNQQKDHHHKSKMMFANRELRFEYG